MPTEDESDSELESDSSTESVPSSVIVISSDSDDSFVNSSDNGLTDMSSGDEASDGTSSSMSSSSSESESSVEEGAVTIRQRLIVRPGRIIPEGTLFHVPNGPTLCVNRSGVLTDDLTQLIQYADRTRVAVRRLNRVDRLQQATSNDTASTSNAVASTSGTSNAGASTSGTSDAVASTSGTSNAGASTSGTSNAGSGIATKEVETKAQKRTAAEMSADCDDDDDDGQKCPICLDSWSDTGEHRLVSLKCGHLFGQSCITTWMKKGVQGKRCPQCNKPCRKSDIRQLYASSIKVKDAEDEERLRQQLQQALKEKRELEIKLHRSELRNSEMLKKEALQKSVMSASSGASVPQRAESKLTFQLIKEIHVGDKGGGRVMSYCPWATQMSVSQASKLCGYGVMQVQCENRFISASLESLHSKMIRDLQYFPLAHNPLLLTASIDRTAKLIDYRCKLAVQTYKAPAPLWSCCWDLSGASMNECYLVSVGMTNGLVARFDMRKVASEPLMTIGKSSDQSPVSSLVSLPPGCCPTLPRGGLVVSQLMSSRLFVGDADYDGTLLPFQTPLLCIRYENKTGHILVSTRAQNERPNFHNVFRLAQGHNVNPSKLFEPVLCVQGGNRQTMLTRSCIASFRDNDLIVAANQEESRIVPIWSVATGARIASMPTSDDVLDITSFSVNANNYFGLLTEKKLIVYQYHM